MKNYLQDVDALDCIYTIYFLILTPMCNRFITLQETNDITNDIIIRLLLLFYEKISRTILNLFPSDR